jgi:hypothetical protein
MCAMKVARYCGKGVQSMPQQGAVKQHKRKKDAPTSLGELNVVRELGRRLWSSKIHPRAVCYGLKVRNFHSHLSIRNRARRVVFFEHPRPANDIILKLCVRE